MAQRDLKSMSTADVVAWVKTLNGSDVNKEKSCAAIEENRVDGQSLFEIEKRDELKDIGIPALFRKTLFDGIGKLKRECSEESAQKKHDDIAKKVKKINEEEQMALMAQKTKKQREERERQNAQKAQNDADPNGKKVSVLGKKTDTSFEIALVMGNIQTRVSMEVSQTVRDLKQVIADREGGNIEHLNLYCKSKNLRDDETLDFVQKAGLPVYASFRVIGGMSGMNKSDEKDEKDDNILRQRLPDFSNKSIKPSMEPDAIMGYDEKDVLRVKMPCGHVFDPVTIYKYVESQMENHNKLEIICPMPKCEQEWEHGVIVSAADLDDKESLKLVTVMQTRAMLKTGMFKKCPGCDTLVQKPENSHVTTMMRVHCVSAACRGKPDFCWLCEKPWQGGGFAVCGNKECHSTLVNEELANCEKTTKVMDRSDVECPTLRACPRCLTLVGYQKACKHMKCWKCKESFCFICLALKDKNGQWGCKTGNSHDGGCELAPVQKIK